MFVLSSSILKECSRFHAGEVLPALRSKGKNKRFDKKETFGRVCRHDFPKFVEYQAWREVYLQYMYCYCFSWVFFANMEEVKDEFLCLTVLNSIIIGSVLQFFKYLEQTRF